MQLEGEGGGGQKETRPVKKRGGSGFPFRNMQYYEIIWRLLPGTGEKEDDSRGGKKGTEREGIFWRSNMRNWTNFCFHLPAIYLTSPT